MVDSKSILNYFRRQNEAKVEIDPTAVLSFIPSLKKEFLSLLGLEEVVQFRLELSDKFEYNVPKRRKGKAKKKNKKSPTSAVEPYTPPKDPLVCAQCNTDFSCLWEQDINGSLLCQSCLKCRWRKEHWCTTNLGGSAISQTSGGLNFHIRSPSSQTETNNSEVQQEAAFPFIQWSASSNGQRNDQKDPRISAFHIMSPGNTSSSPLSSPRFYFDPSSILSSPSPSDSFSSPFNYSSPFYTSYLSNSSSSSYYPSSSECNSTSSSMSPSPPHCSQYSRKKVRAPYWMDTLLAKSSLKDSKDKEETMEDKNRGLTWKSPLQSKEYTEKTPISESQPVASHSLSSLTMELGPSTSIPVFSAGKQKSKTEMVKPTLKKTTEEEHISQTVHPELKPKRRKLQKAASDILSMELKQHSVQKTQVCNTGSVMMASTTSIPLLSANKQKAKTEKLKPCLKNATKEEHPCRTVHENLKLNQGKLPKVSSDILSMEVTQHNVQKTQVCNTGSVNMTYMTSTPLLNASKQKVKTEKPKPSLKKTNKEEHTSRTVHEKLKLDQGYLPKFSFDILSMEVKQHNAQKTQVCNTGSVMMTYMTSEPVLSANKQKVKTEKLKPSLKNVTKEEHPSRTVHEKLKLDQGNLPKFPSDILSMELKQHNAQKTQVCNTGSVMMASTTTTPLLSTSEQKVETEKLKPSLKNATKEEHTSRTMHENLKQNQSKLQKASSSLSHNSNLSTDKTSGSPSSSSHSAKFKEQTSRTLSFGNVSSPVPSLSTQTVRKGPKTKQTKLAFPSVSPSHSSKSSQYLPKFSIHHTPSTPAATSKTFPDSGEEHQQALWSGPRCVSECKPDPLIRSLPTNASSTQQGKTRQQAVVPQKAKVSKSGCPECTCPTGFESQKIKVHQRMGSSSVPDKIRQKPK